MTEGTHRTWDIIFKFAFGIGAIVTFYCGIVQFEITSRRDFSKEIYKEELLFYKDLSFVTAILANPDTDDSVKSLFFDRFDVIYFGTKDFFVKDSILNDNIRKYNDAVTFMKNGILKFSNDQSTDERAQEYALKIGQLSRKNIDRIIYYLKSEEE